MLKNKYKIQLTLIIMHEKNIFDDNFVCVEREQFFLKELFVVVVIF